MMTNPRALDGFIYIRIWIWIIHDFASSDYITYLCWFLTISIIFSAFKSDNPLRLLIILYWIYIKVTIYGTRKWQNSFRLSPRMWLLFLLKPIFTGRTRTIMSLFISWNFQNIFILAIISSIKILLGWSSFIEFIRRWWQAWQPSFVAHIFKFERFSIKVTNLAFTTVFLKLIHSINIKFTIF